MGASLTRGCVELYLNYNDREPSSVEIWSHWANLMGENPTEQGRDIVREHEPKADEMEATLLAFLKSVDAETPSDSAISGSSSATKM